MPLATHKGTCQCCGAIQKLPDGVLSKHGYRVLWNEFRHICNGAGHLPYEQSCGLITSFVEAARQHQTVLLARVAELREPATEPRGWWHEYIHGGFTAKSNYDWRLVDIEIDTNGDVGFINHAGKFEAFYRHCLRPSDVLDAATIINTKRADAIERDDLPQLARYISWQKRRINEWQLRPLYPVSQRVKVEAFV